MLRAELLTLGIQRNFLLQTCTAKEKSSGVRKTALKLGIFFVEERKKSCPSYDMQEKPRGVYDANAELNIFPVEDFHCNVQLKSRLEVHMIQL